MKKVVSLVLAIVLMATMFCGCTQEMKVKVNKDGSCSVSIMLAIPVETMEEMLASGEYTEDDMDDMVIKTVNGEECYVEEETKKFSTYKKANTYMKSEEIGLFSRFTVAKTGFSAALIEGTKDSLEMYEDSIILKLRITMPYLITNTNGSLSKDKKTATFDLAKIEKPYAYTSQSDKGKAVYFIEEYLKSNTSAYLNWNSVKGATKYKVSYKASGDKSWKSVTTTKHAKTVTGLKEGTKYTFKVTAVTKSGNHTSMTTSVTTLKPVTAKVKSKTDKSIKLTWSKDSNATGYIVYRRTSKNGSWVKVNSTKTNSYNVTKLKGEKTYYFKVVAYTKVDGKVIKSTGKALTAKTY